jgi:hypothetical protein
MTAADSREQMIATARAHAAAEANADIDATMATLDDDPVYELLPMGRMLRGSDTAREYYEHFFATCLPRVRRYDLRSEWVADDGLGQEYTLYLEEPDGTTRRHDILGILVFGSGSRLSGERIYASNELLEVMFGPVLDRSEPV